MGSRITSIVLLGLCISAAATGLARADVCVSIDRAHDTFSEADRSAALILIARQFEAEGQRVVDGQCTNAYTISHVKLGDTITVTLAGPGGERRAMAIGMNDVPAVYSQLVRALLTGREVGALTKVVDRTNVIATQASPLRAQADSLFYARLGFGGPVGAGGHAAGPAMGLGIRRELDSVAIDVSFMNIQTQTRRGYSYYGDSGSTGSWLKLEVLRYAKPRADGTFYWGGGASWGGLSSSTGTTHWSGNGLQGELTAGYEMLRAANIRIFAQTDVVLPFYSATASTYIYNRAASVVTSSRYFPAATVSVGLGWQRGPRGRP